MSIPLTLTQYLIQRLADHPDQRDLVLIMNDLATIGKFISKEINRAGLVDILGTVGTKNVHGDQVQKLDVLANEQCKNYLKQTGHFAALASEEEEGVVDMGNFGKDAKYVIAFDPLDGSSNIEVNVSVGTIFSVHKLLPDLPRVDERQFLQRGRDQVLAGYILYGSSTVIVFSFGSGVSEFTLEPSLGEFLLSREKILIPEDCGIYSVNEGNINFFKEKDRNFVNYLKQDLKCSTRYIGSLVSDTHRNIIKGGIFMYPAIDKEKKGDYKGKLRINFEAKTMAFLVEEAGGVAINGEQNILDIVPTKLHEKCALVMGNKNIIENYFKF